MLHVCKWLKNCASRWSEHPVYVLSIAAGVGTPRRKPIDRMALLSEPIAPRSLAIHSYFTSIFSITSGSFTEAFTLLSNCINFLIILHYQYRNIIDQYNVYI